jgi:hypothetical protein
MHSAGEDDSLDLHSIVAKIRALEQKVAQLEADGSQRLHAEAQLKVWLCAQLCMAACAHRSPVLMGTLVARAQGKCDHAYFLLRRRWWLVNIHSSSSSTKCFRKCAIAYSSFNSSRRWFRARTPALMVPLYFARWVSATAGLSRLY